MIKNVIITRKLKRKIKKKYKRINKKKYKTFKKIKTKKKKKKLKLCVERTCVYKNPVIGILTVPV